MKRRAAPRRVVGREAQVDLCPPKGGMVVSIGRVSFWVDRAEAEDLVETMERALLLWSRGATANDSSSGDGAPVARRVGASS